MAEQIPELSKLPGLGESNLQKNQKLGRLYFYSWEQLKNYFNNTDHFC